MGAGIPVGDDAIRQLHAVAAEFINIDPTLALAYLQIPAVMFDLEAARVVRRALLLIWDQLQGLGKGAAADAHIRQPALASSLYFKGKMSVSDRLGATVSA